jgi:hypothetical protein
MLLDQNKLKTLVEVSVLHAAHPEVLSRFEEEVLWALNERALVMGDYAMCTLDEWAVVEMSMAALTKVTPPSAFAATSPWNGAEERV